MSDRIGLNDDGTCDDICLDATYVHIEDMGDCFSIIVDRADGERFQFRVGSVSGRARTVCHMTEFPVGSLREDDE